MSNFDAERFAKWLENAFRQSKFKSYSQLADHAGLKRSTVSSLVTAKPQTATGKASQPKTNTVIKLAEALDADIDEVLLLAGHAPRSITLEVPTTMMELMEALKRLGIPIEHVEPFDLPPEDYAKLLDDIRLVVALRSRR